MHQEWTSTSQVWRGIIVRQAHRHDRAYLSGGSLHRAIIATEEDAAQCEASAHSTASILPLEAQDQPTGSSTAVAKQLEGLSEGGWASKGGVGIHQQAVGS